MEENTTTEQIATRKVYANKLHAKLGHLGEYRISATTKHLHYIIKGTPEVWEEYATEKSKQKSLQKVAEEGNLEPGEMIYIVISSQKKPSYGVSKNWVLIQDFNKKKTIFLHEDKIIFI